MSAVKKTEVRCAKIQSSDKKVLIKLPSLEISYEIKGQLNSEWMNLWGHWFPQKTNQEFEGFLPWKFIRR